MQKIWYREHVQFDEGRRGANHKAANHTSQPSRNHRGRSFISERRTISRDKRTLVFLNNTLLYSFMNILQREGIFFLMRF